MSTQNQLQMSAEDLNAFLNEEFPQMAQKLDVTNVSPNQARVTMHISVDDLRPGGTVSGPTMFALADCTFYVATLAMIGPKALTVTTSCAIDFMRKPQPTSLIAEARILKLGRTLSVGDVLIFNEGMDAPVAHANLTYSIPPQK